MREQLDLLEEFIPQQSDAALLDILAANAERHDALAIDFAADELKSRGYKIDHNADGFEVSAPGGGKTFYPKRTAAGGGAKLPDLDAAAPQDAGPPVGVGGWLALFIIDLVLIGPALALLVDFALGTGVELIPHYPLLGWVTVFERASVLLIRGVGLYAGIRLYRLEAGAVGFAKKYLVVSAVYATLVSGALYWAAQETGQAEVQENFRGTPAMVISMWVGTLIWYLYLGSSRRVAATYELSAEETNARGGE